MELAKTKTLRADAPDGRSEPVWSQTAVVTGYVDVALGTAGGVRVGR